MGKKFIICSPVSDPGFGEVHVIQELNHLNICKPETRDSHVYQMTLNFIQSLIPEVELDLEEQEKMDEDLHNLFDIIGLFS